MFDKLKTFFKKKESIPVKPAKRYLRTRESIENNIESIIGKKVIDTKTQLKYKIIEIIATNSAIYESLDDVSNFFKEKNIHIDIDMKEVEKLVEIPVKYRLIKEFIAINGKAFDKKEAEILVKTMAKALGIKLEDGITNNATMVLGSNYQDSVDMVKNLLKELDETSKALELGAYTEVKD